MNSLANGGLIGLLAGLASGLLGVSPGGILVPVSILVLGCSQHVAQGISLIAQIPPTSLAAVKRYRIEGIETPRRWVIWLAAGFLAGGVLGALAAAGLSNLVLRWSYVGYLVVLEVLLLTRKSSQAGAGAPPTPAAAHPGALLAIGLVAGFSSGVLGIGGGLATTVGLAGLMRLPQHQAQAVSLVLSSIPLTIPAASIYVLAGWSVPWSTIVGIVVGLWLGNDLGARLATRLDAGHLRVLTALLIAAFAVYMAVTAALAMT